VLAPLAVCGGLNKPQAFVGAQLQVTPLFAESFVTVAAMVAVALVFSEAGGGVDSVMEIGGAVTLTVAVAVLVPSETEAAVIVTLPPWGALTGAV
jgi:hypothetical protein